MERYVLNPALPLSNLNGKFSCTDISHEQITAGVHRVVTPTPNTTDNSTLSDRVVPERYSIPFFVKADNQASVGPLPQFLAGSNVTRFEEMSAIEYYQARNRKAYLQPDIVQAGTFYFINALLFKTTMYHPCRDTKMVEPFYYCSQNSQQLF